MARPERCPRLAAVPACGCTIRRRRPVVAGLCCAEGTIAHRVCLPGLCDQCTMRIAKAYTRSTASAHPIRQQMEKSHGLILQKKEQYPRGDLNSRHRD